MSDLSEVFHRRIAAAELSLLEIDEDASQARFRPGGWTRKQILGHLLDSTVNNHLRFVRAALEPEYRGPQYDQDAWVRLHRYEALPWRRLVGLWSAHNYLLAHLVAQIPPDRQGTPCTIGDGPAVPLRVLIADYLDHLDGHIEQIDTAGE